LQSRAKREGIDVASDVLELIAERNQHNIRELEGSLNRVIAYTRLLKLTPTLELAEKAMADIASKQPEIGSNPTPDYILKVVADCFQSSIEALKSHKRDRQSTLARQVAMYLIRRHTGHSLEQIGREMGNREPISVSSACKKITSNMQTDPELKQKVLVIEKRVALSNGTAPNI
jgi:chromosomal replication initiator protein